MRFEKVMAINPPSPPGYVVNRDSMGGYGQLYPMGAAPFRPSYQTSHEAMIGNEYLTKDQIQSLHRFALFFQRFLINRGGVLKDDNRSGLYYSNARSVANLIANFSARMLFAMGRRHFERAYGVASSPARQGVLQ